MSEPKMPGSEFVHLHLHSQYSLLDGAIKVKKLFPALKAMGMDAVAMTDHGNMFGVVDFLRNAKEAGIRPIVGCEVYVAGQDGRFDRTHREAYHLVLLARDLEGYRNLSYLVSMAFIEGFYYEPRIDKALLAKHAKGLVGMTACLGGEVNQALLSGDADRAVRVARELRDCFEPGCFFIELQRTGLPEQEQVIPRLREIARDLKVGVVATNDCHYLKSTDARAHDILLCIQTGKDFNDPSRLRHQTDSYYLRSGAEMAAVFADCPEAIANTRAIADMCTLSLEFKDTFLPRFKVPDGYDVDGYFEKAAREGFARRVEGRGLQGDRKVYRDRLDFEIATIKKMGFASYFLIVSDFITYAKKQGIPVGPGRGSGAGSLVAYSLDITDLDPIRYGLLFERFLNPERISMPDIDTDFCERRRGEVIEYVKQKYGDRNVGQIVTFSQLNTKSIIKDVSRTLGIPFDEVNRVTKGIPSAVTENEKVVKVTVDMALKIEPKLKDWAERDARFADVIDISRTLEGLNRQTGVHAAGVVIAERPLWELVPVCLDKDGQLLTQFSMGDAEKAGLVKFDFLGLKTLTMIDNAVRMLRAGGAEVNVADLTFDDPEVFALIAAGETDGVFQLESQGFKEMLKRLKPTRFEEIVAATALYRPGPLKAGLVDEYIERKNGRRKVVYPHKSAEPFLKETYGVIVYQEQVMQLSVALSGFTMGKADKLRKAMGKKDPVEMDKLGADFIGGATTKAGMPAAAANLLWDQIKQFAGYAFNKSHSAAYSVVTYQTAWIKTHHPMHFMAALMSSEMGDQERVVNYIQSARRLGIEVLQPDINESDLDFSVKKGKIRFGLLAIRGIGEAVVDEILRARGGGPFGSLFDFCDRVDLGKVGKKPTDLLIRAGAFDYCGAPRAAMAAALDGAVEAAAKAQRSKKMGQASLFGGMSCVEGDLPKVGEWDEKTRLTAEKEALGFYISGHPMARYAAEMRRYVATPVSEVKRLAGPREVTIGGIVARLEVKITKTGQGKMAIIALEDLTGQAEVVVPPQVFEKSEAALRGYDPVWIRAFLAPEVDDERDGGGEGPRRQRSRLRAMKVVPLGELRKESVKRITVHVTTDDLQGGAAQRLRKLLDAHPGACAVSLCITNTETGMQTVVAADDALTVSPDDALLADLAFQFPDVNVSLG